MLCSTRSFSPPPKQRAWVLAAVLRRAFHSALVPQQVNQRSLALTLTLTLTLTLLSLLLAWLGPLAC